MSRPSVQLSPRPKDTPTARQIAEHLAEIEAVKRKARTTRIALVVGAVAASVLIVGILSLTGGAIYRDAQISSLAPASVKESADFTLLAPYEPSIRVDADSYTYSNGLVSYNVATDVTVYAINQQALPSSFDLFDFANGQGLETPVQYKTRLGNALMGSLNGNDIVIFEGQDVLITAVARSAANNEDRQLLVDSFVEVE